ncbi:Gfo/Idh/MocA family protein [Geochorda subterranea]|uniref:Gfo/Idh/MocA family oxidoreductase n=1 Tax=Geochorda subterranea TaxID=3109564 RepID=A0ABZ1BSN9_9FIRM|nr:Gfo/Idh/MocA family oxidoreductase [Limnochorda sp. LNt]WRP15749.1 Gfo/Idh/MocA family oxidoreductase [Limnochorda sp. LNt]
MEASTTRSSPLHAPQEPVRWGILGTARIARHRVLPALASSAVARVVAVGSRERQAAEAFARDTGIERAYGSYDEVLHDPEVEAVYIPLPNHLHLPWIERAAAAGKHVLCEKPLTLDRQEAERARRVCREAGVLLMEAFMWRWQPRYARLRQLLDEEAVGEVRLVRAAFSFVLPDLAANIRGKPEWGGGALFDVGCYCVNAARWVFGAEPTEVHCSSHVDPQLGVDLTTTGILRFPGGREAVFDASFEMTGGQRLEIVGTRGTVWVPRPFQPNGIDGFYVGGASGDLAVGAGAEGPDTPGGQSGRGPRDAASEHAAGGPAPPDHYRLQFEAFSRWVQEGRKEPVPPGEDGLLNMAVLDACARSARERRPVAVAPPA